MQSAPLLNHKVQLLRNYFNIFGLILLYPETSPPIAFFKHVALLISGNPLKSQLCCSKQLEIRKLLKFPGKHPEGVPLYIPFISIRICTDDICGQCGFFQLQDLTSFPRWSSCNETGSQRSWVILFDSLASFLASGLFVAVSYLHRLPAWGSNWYLWGWWWSLPDVSQDCGQ